jgi:hypothetical protein
MAIQTIWVDLILDNGELVQIECPSKYEDDLHDNLENAMKRGGWWAPTHFSDCRAKYLGIYLDRVNMRRVVGITLL